MSKEKEFEQTLLYKVPGHHRGPFGISYDYKLAETQKEKDDLKKNGWADSIRKSAEK